MLGGVLLPDRTHEIGMERNGSKSGHFAEYSWLTGAQAKK